MLIERLLENLAISVDPFATCGVAQGWRLRLPRREWVVFHFVLGGEGTLRTGGGEVHPLRTNFLAIIPPGLAHSIECGSAVHRESLAADQVTDAPICALLAGPPEEVRLTVACGRVQVTYGDALGLFDLMRGPLILDFSDLPPMRGTFEALIGEYGSDEPGSKAMMTALMNQCLVLIFRRVGQQPEYGLPWLSALEDPALARVIDAILEHPEQPHSVDSLASQGNMSRSVFARRFAECFGATPMDYVRGVRLRQGARLLHRPELSVTDIATRVGFASRSHFSRAFSEQFGCSPKEFRARAR